MRERVGVARRHQEPGLAVGADDLGQRAARGGDQRHAARHRLDRREREALVERRHDRDLGLGVELDDALGGDARHEPHRVVEAEPLDERGDLALVLGLADEHELGVVALGAHLGQRLEQRHEALHRHVGAGGGHEPTGHAGDLGHRAEDLRVDADGHDVQAVVARRPSARTMSRLLDSDTVTTRGIARATFICMPRKPYQRRSVKRRHALVACVEVEVAVDGDRVVQRREDRPAVVHHPEQAGAEALVVVDEVEVGAARASAAGGRAG